MHFSLLVLTFCLFVAHHGRCYAFLPGLHPHTFRENDSLPIGIVPLSDSVPGAPDFHDLPFCQDTTLWRVQPQYLADVLLNTQLLPTPYDIKILTNVTCRFLCLVPNFANQGIAPKRIGECETEPHPQKASGDVMFTYSVYWIRSTNPWPSRWDHLFVKKGLGISFSEALVWIVFACAPVVILYVLCKILLRQLESSHRTKAYLWEPLKEHTHQVGHDRIDLLSSLVGSGVQLLAAAFVTALAAVYGLRDPAARVSMMQLSFYSFVGLGAVNGYISTKILGSFKYSDIMGSVLLSSILPSTIVQGLLLLLNWTLSVGGYSHAIPLATSLSIYLWALSICSMTVYVGSLFGSFTSRTDTQPLLSYSGMHHELDSWELPKIGFRYGGGLLLSSAVGATLFYHSTLLPHQLSYPSLLLAFGGFIVISGCISIVSTYYQHLCGNAKWWWESFFVPSFSSLFFVGAGCALATLLFWSGQGHAALILAAYSVLGASVVALAAGAVGFLASWLLASMVACHRVKLDGRCNL
ncbi:unnamed protein product [Closterium sp. Yama58-4]|nr:unnamed protein product [Closterium sp. Yama58-4]